jgi:hypothetical protein
MMDKNKTIDLIKSHVLGCLNKEAEMTLKSFMEDSENFPWKELGEYQNLAAMIPLNLPVEHPGDEVKTRIVQKLTELKAQLVEASSEDEELLQDAGEDNILLEEQPILTDQFQHADDEQLSDISEFELSSDTEEVSADTSGLQAEEKIKTRVQHTPVQQTTETIKQEGDKQKSEPRRSSKMKDIIEREEFEKRTKEYINTYYHKKFEDLKTELQKVFIIAVAAAGLALLALIIAMFA